MFLALQYFKKIPQIVPVWLFALMLTMGVRGVDYFYAQFKATQPVMKLP